MPTACLSAGENLRRQAPHVGRRPTPSTPCANAIPRGASARFSARPQREPPRRSAKTTSPKKTTSCSKNHVSRERT
eukprot:11873473-Alexandrium_andersonii.AAC.1